MGLGTVAHAEPPRRQGTRYEFGTQELRNKTAAPKPIAEEHSPFPQQLKIWPTTTVASRDKGHEDIVPLRNEPSAAEAQPRTIAREGREGGEGRTRAGLSFVFCASCARPRAKRICAGRASFAE